MHLFFLYSFLHLRHYFLFIISGQFFLFRMRLTIFYDSIQTRSRTNRMVSATLAVAIPVPTIFYSFYFLLRQSFFKFPSSRCLFYHFQVSCRLRLWLWLWLQSLLVLPLPLKQRNSHVCSWGRGVFLCTLVFGRIPPTCNEIYCFCMSIFIYYPFSISYLLHSDFPNFSFSFLSLSNFLVYPWSSLCHPHYPLSGFSFGLNQIPVVHTTFIELINDALRAS